MGILLLQEGYGLLISGEAGAFDGLYTGKASVGNLSEGLPGVYIRYMDLHCGNRYSLQGIQDRHAGMGVGGWVDDNAVDFSVGSLDFIYQISFVIGLVNLYLHTQIFGGLLQ